AALDAVVAQQRSTPGAQLRLEAAGRVVDAGMDDAGVVTGLVGAEPAFLLEDDDSLTRAAARDLPTDGEAEDAAADDHDTAVLRSHESNLGREAGGLRARAPSFATVETGSHVRTGRHRAHAAQHHLVRLRGTLAGAG